jgi:hypothetical protein
MTVSCERLQKISEKLLQKIFFILFGDHGYSILFLILFFLLLGVNEVNKIKRREGWILFWNQYKDPL